jgi:hypothetical protein
MVGCRNDKDAKGQDDAVGCMNKRYRIQRAYRKHDGRDERDPLINIQKKGHLLKKTFF